jgi:hypothetical protein
MKTIAIFINLRGITLDIRAKIRLDLCIVIKIIVQKIQNVLPMETEIRTNKKNKCMIFK